MFFSPELPYSITWETKRDPQESPDSKDTGTWKSRKSEHREADPGGLCGVGPCIERSPSTLLQWQPGNRGWHRKWRKARKAEAGLSLVRAGIL